MSQKTTSLLQKPSSVTPVDAKQIYSMTNAELTRHLQELISKINDLEVNRKLGDIAAKMEVDGLRQQVYAIWKEQRDRKGTNFPQPGDLYIDKLSNDIYTIIAVENENEIAVPWMRMMTYITGGVIRRCQVRDFVKSNDIEKIDTEIT